MQAILVKFVGPTNTKPSRWSVSCQAGRMIISKGHFCDTNDDKDARQAALALCDKLKWNTNAYGQLVEGGLPNGDRVFVFTS
jgi:hypothetical protein